jgi:toxin ParE1/3/4
MASVSWTVEAEEDLNRLIESVARTSRRYATGVRLQIDASVEQLQQFPRMGMVVPEYGRDSLRELIVGMQRVIYTAEEDEVRIMGIIHGSRDLMRALRGREP